MDNYSESRIMGQSRTSDGSAYATAAKTVASEEVALLSTECLRGA
jgi:hypothetical protein